MNIKNLIQTSLIGILLIGVVSCEVEPYEPTTGEDLIQQESALYSYLQIVTDSPDSEVLEVGCVEFIYPFILYVYDTEAIFARQESILDNQDFTTLLANLEEDYSIGLSYPITGFLQDGSSLEITSNEELEASLQACIEAEIEHIIGVCNGIATAEECVWDITESSLMDNPYVSLPANFSLEDDGSVSFQVEEVIYRGTWIFYFIGNDLHMNMFFEYEENTNPETNPDLLPIKEDWNFDWKINYIDTEKIEIENHLEQAYTLERVCEEEMDDIEN